jgi:WD40 repeat protein
VAGCAVRFSLRGWTQAALLAALVGALVVFTAEPTPDKDESPAWAAPTGHPQWVRAVALAPDGRRLATGGIDGAVVLWQVGRGAERELPDHPAEAVLCLAFAPDGAALAAGSLDATVRLWDVTTGQKRATLRGHWASVQCLAFAPDGKTLATGSADRTIRLWDLPSGRMKASPLEHPTPVSAVGFAPDGRTLASGCAGGQVKLWDLADGQGRERSAGVRIHRGMVRCVAFAPDGSLVASGTNDGIMLWDVATGQERAAVPTAHPFIQAAVFAPEGRTLIVAMGRGIIQHWDLDAGHETARRRIHGERYRVAFSSDGRFVASGGTDAMVRVWDLADAVTTGVSRMSEPPNPRNLSAASPAK